MAIDSVARKLSAPVNVDLVLNQDCNHRCLHCYNPWQKPSQDYNMPYQDRIKLIVTELKKNNVWTAVLTGGEPFVHPERVFTVIGLLQKANLSIGLNTNLSLMTKEFATRLAVDYGWCTEILTSLPAVTAEMCDRITQKVGSFDRILRGITICKDAGLSIAVNVVVSKKNLADLTNIEEFLTSYDIDFLSLSPAVPPFHNLYDEDYYLEAMDIVHIANLLKTIQQRFGIRVGSVTPLPLCILNNLNDYAQSFSATCGAGINKSSIDVTTGGVTACAHESVPYGNIYEDGLIACWENMTDWRLGTPLQTECKQCDCLPICGGECRMMRKADDDSLFKYKLTSNPHITYTPLKKKIGYYDQKERYQVNPELKFRKEEFGGIVRVDFENYFISKQMVRFYNNTKKISSFSLKEMESSYILDADFMKMFSFLYETGIIKTLKESNC